MIGNDIIDRQAAAQESNWRRPGFVDKVFTALERELILVSSEPDLIVWLIWSMKESAYKIINREQDIRKFNPKSFEASNLEVSEDSARGCIKYDDITFYPRSSITNDKIDTIALSNQSHLMFVLDVAPEQKIGYKNNRPFCIASGRAVSKSHHGRFERTVILSDTQLLL